MVIVTIMLRLTDGSRVRRRFLRSDTMGKVLDWADVQGVDLEAQQLSSSLPKVCGKEDLCYSEFEKRLIDFPIVCHWFKFYTKFYINMKNKRVKACYFGC